MFYSFVFLSFLSFQTFALFPFVLSLFPFCPLRLSNSAGYPALTALFTRQFPSRSPAPFSLEPFCSPPFQRPFWTTVDIACVRLLFDIQRAILPPSPLDTPSPPPDCIYAYFFFRSFFMGDFVLSIAPAGQPVLPPSSAHQVD